MHSQLVQWLFVSSSGHLKQKYWLMNGDRSVMPLNQSKQHWTPYSTRCTNCFVDSFKDDTTFRYVADEIMVCMQTPLGTLNRSWYFYATKYRLNIIYCNTYSLVSIPSLVQSSPGHAFKTQSITLQSCSQLLCNKLFTVQPYASITNDIKISTFGQYWI